MLEGTIFAPGDYDECIELSTPTDEGMFCMVEVLMRSKMKGDGDSTTVGQSLSQLVPMKGFFNPRFAICLPASCTEQDVISLIRSSLEGYPMTVSENISCQTKRDLEIGFFTNLSLPQQLSV